MSIRRFVDRWAVLDVAPSVPANKIVSTERGHRSTSHTTRIMLVDDRAASGLLALKLSTILAAPELSPQYNYISSPDLLAQFEELTLPANIFPHDTPWHSPSRRAP